MADKPTVSSVGSNSNINSTTLNNNFDTLATAIEGCLGRGGTGESPNPMQGNLDLNNYKAINSGAPTNDGDLATKKYIDDNYSAAATAAAQTYATAAEASATAAAASETDAEAALADFNLKYVVSATEPGSPFEGQLWYDTTNDILKIYDSTSSSFLPYNPTLQAINSRDTYTATAGQTTFNHTYEVGDPIFVFRNGSQLAPADYIATTGTNVVLAVGADLNDIVEIWSLGNFVTVTATSANTANAVVRRDGSGNFAAGTITANLTGNVTGNVTGNFTNAAPTANGELIKTDVTIPFDVYRDFNSATHNVTTSYTVPLEVNVGVSSIGDLYLVSWYVRGLMGDTSSYIEIAVGGDLAGAGVLRGHTQFANFDYTKSGLITTLSYYQLSGCSILEQLSTLDSDQQIQLRIKNLSGTGGTIAATEARMIVTKIKSLV